MKVRTMAAVLAVWASAFPAATSLRAQGNPDWHRAIPGFKIAGNLYYVGTADLAVLPDQHAAGQHPHQLRLQGGCAGDQEKHRSSGFKYADTKIILISHAHGDHDEATGVIQKDTGAKLMVMEGDVADEESTAPGRPGAHVDRPLHDGDTVELGGATLVARLTPGHTKAAPPGRCRCGTAAARSNAVIIGSPNVNPGYVLVGNKNYPQIAEDYVKTFAVLKALPVDLFLGAHGAYFGLAAKYPKLKRGRPEPVHRPGRLQGLRRGTGPGVSEGMGPPEANPPK